MSIKKIVVIGPESTGKSTLCKQLAQHYTTQWVPEYAREYLLKNGTDYTYEDLLTIAKGQIALEEKIVNQQSKIKDFIFIDTDMYVMKVWCEFVFGKCHRYILNEIVNRKYDLYLLCKPDLPWVKDELREYPDLESRQKLYCIYKDILINQHTPWVEIQGYQANRLQQAITAVEEYMVKNT
ncbi:MAG: AAA family ATPase [Niabella sp.]